MKELEIRIRQRDYGRVTWEVTWNLHPVWHRWLVVAAYKAWRASRRATKAGAK